MKHKIGFIGAGTMGKGMIENLVKNGFDVSFYNRTPKEIEGANYINSLKELEGEVIFICVSNDNALRELFEQINFKPGTIFVDCGTTSLKLTEEIKQRCEEKNVEFLDAPITGSKLGAESGNLLFMVGGKKEVFDKLSEEFEAMGKKAVYCGPTPLGQKIKHVLNLTQSNILQSYLEGVTFALRNGVSLEATLEVFENSGAKNGVGTTKLASIKQRNFEPHFLLELMNKDLHLAESEIEELGLKLPLSENTIRVFDRAMSEGLNREDMSAIVKLLEKDNDVEIKE